MFIENCRPNVYFKHRYILSIKASGTRFGEISPLCKILIFGNFYWVYFEYLVKFWTYFG